MIKAVAFAAQKTMRYLLPVSFIVFVMGCGGQFDNRAGNGSVNRPPAGNNSLPKEFTVVFRQLPLLDTRDEWYKEIGAEELKEVLAFLAEDIGMEDDSGALMPLLARKTPMPVQKKCVLSTVTHNQASLVIPFRYGSIETPEQTHRIGSMEICGLPRGPAGQPRIEITIDVGWQAPEPMQSNLTVTAKDLSTGAPLMLRRVP